MPVKNTISPLCLLFLLALLDSVLSDCSVCSSLNDIACVSETTFQLCKNSIPTGDILACPYGHVCLAEWPEICRSNEPGVIPSCMLPRNDCMQCDATDTFACTSATTFALCLNNSLPSDIIFTCVENYYCNVDYPEICVDANQGFLPTCPIMDDVTTTTTATTTTTVAPNTTPSPITNPNAYCQIIQEYGRFPAGNDFNTTCRQYVLCVLIRGIWTGVPYQCPNKTFFDSSIRLCRPTVPSYCKANAQNLMFARSLLLIEDS